MACGPDAVRRPARLRQHPGGPGLRDPRDDRDPLGGHQLTIAEPLVAVCQLAPVVGDLAGNRRRAAEAVVEAARRGADVVVLPELVTSGYVFRDATEAQHLAEPADGPTVAAWHDLADRHGLVVVGGICERDDDGQLRISSVIVDRTGLRAVYRKAHLWDVEADVFVPGDEAPPVVVTDAGRIATMVCYDVEFPEWIRMAALAGADLLCVPTNWPVCGPAPGPFPAEVLRLLAAANVNGMYVAAAARVGHERGVDWVPGSGIAAPDGTWLTEPTDDAAVLTARIDVARARDKRTSARNDVLGDRRPELYGALLAPVRTAPSDAAGT